MVSGLVLITGATGHIGFKTLLTALKSGYNVRAAVRSDAKRDQILANASIKGLNPGSALEFAIVPDLTIPGAYEKAIQEVEYIIHLASPIVLKGADLNNDNFKSELIDPAIAGTINILEAAMKSPSVRRVVITSSVVAIIDMKWFFDDETPLGVVWNGDSRIPNADGPYPSDFHAYNASKIFALNATEKFIAERKPNFDVVHIAPAFVVGKNELVTEVKDIHLGTNGPVTSQVILGSKASHKIPGATVHVDDVAYMHVKALDEAVPASTYLAVSEGYAGTLWGNAGRIVAENFPQAVQKGILRVDGDQPSRRTRFDSSKSEDVMGFKFQNYEAQVKSVVQHYLELLGEDVA